MIRLFAFPACLRQGLLRCRTLLKQRPVLQPEKHPAKNASPPVKRRLKSDSITVRSKSRTKSLFSQQFWQKHIRLKTCRSPSPQQPAAKSSPAGYPAKLRQGQKSSKPLPSPSSSQLFRIRPVQPICVSTKGPLWADYCAFSSLQIKLSFVPAYSERSDFMRGISLFGKSGPITWKFLPREQSSSFPPLCAECGSCFFHYRSQSQGYHL